ncbi:unnamed protein product [Brassica rapa]|uniref:Uncharacterized protein n=2 Tax=Brassica TaxID=3705 RepID=A0A3P5YVE9_BRACM|nr:unnamed protein product [Brassica napus]CAG7868125.1 unnamed protein product [Brassica rapa]CDY50963.1 BnaA06g37590D [Brassica napus]VDC65020.1 unnamed protein product [Brassica rapa]
MALEFGKILLRVRRRGAWEGYLDISAHTCCPVSRKANKAAKEGYIKELMAILSRMYLVDNVQITSKKS